MSTHCLYNVLCIKPLAACLLYQKNTIVALKEDTRLHVISNLNVFGKGDVWLKALLVVNSPIFSLRLVHMTVGASSHFASFVLKQVLDSLSFAGQLYFKIIVHFFTSVQAECIRSFPFFVFIFLKRRLGGNYKSDTNELSVWQFS